ncbi:MAG: bifunctional metallophosphatase/5'-nucleotidase [Lentisphaeraceae bacterium]|nr:bifunctional metallophosphatase/5'-nucleotidase [Lentisphaeraceae bacterium]
MSCFYRVSLFFSLIFISSGYGEEKKLKILHTTDVHCQIHNHKGGWLKLAGAVNELRNEWGEDNCLLIDCGDTIQGSIEAVATRGEVAIDFINYLNYDAWVLGNHELDFGIPRLYDLINKTKVPIINGNFVLTRPKPKSFDAYKVYKRAGIKVAVIGMQASFLRHWFIGEDYESYEVKKVVEVLPGILEQVKKENAGLIILALHHGFNFSESRGVNEIREVTKLFPEIDLVLGGHTHQFHPGKNIYGTYYCQAGFHASHLGVVEAELKKGGKELKKFKSKLVNVDKYEVPLDLAELYKKKWSTLVKSYADYKVVDLAKEISSKGHAGINCETAYLIGESIRIAARVDMAIHGKFSKKSLSGSVTRKDLFEMIPYENNIFVLEVTKSQLELIMKEQLQLFRKSHFNAPVGFHVELGSTTSEISKISYPLDKDVYKLAINSRVAAGGGGRFPYIRQLLKKKLLPFHEVKINTRTAVENYLKGKRELNFQQTVFTSD